MLQRIVLLLIISTTGLYAQDWRCIVPFQHQYFEEQNHQLIPEYADNASAVKVAYFDSSVVNGNITENFSFTSFRDTTLVLGTTPCAVYNGPSWLGWKVKEDSDQTVFYNIYNDSLIIRQMDSVGSSWICSHFLTGYNFWATVDSIQWTTSGGITDSVKFISINLKDNNGIPVAHPFNNHQFEISKSNGFFKTYSLWNFPSNTNEINRIAPLTLPTTGTLNSFQINDQFEYRYVVTTPLSGTIISNLTWITIDSSFINATGDSLYYIRDIHAQNNTLFFNPTPNWVTANVLYTDTILYPDINNAAFNGFPEENSLDTLNQPSNYTIRNNPDTSQSKLLYQTGNRFAFLDTVTNCLSINTFEPNYTFLQYAEGLGLVRMEEINMFFNPGNSYSNTLIWYQKGAKTWGNFIPVSGINEINKNLLHIFPNPVTNTFIITGINNAKTDVFLYDMQGRMLKKFENKNNNDFDISEIVSGMYLVKVISGKDIYSQLIIKR
ncbi:MAG: T9SS type A sorting domain-containing protein [Bacteroidota bacterium]